MRFWHQRSRAVQVDNDFTLLTESIKEEQRRIQQIDQELERRGIDSTPIDALSEGPLDKNTNCANDRGGQRSMCDTTTPTSGGQRSIYSTTTPDIGVQSSSCSTANSDIEGQRSIYSIPTPDSVVDLSAIIR